MKKVFLTIVLIVIASSIYIGYQWATFDHEEAEKDPKTEAPAQQDSNDNENDEKDKKDEKDVQLSQSESVAYDDYWKSLIDDFNEQTHLLFNEDDFHIMGFLQDVVLFSTVGENGKTTVTEHSYQFDEQGEPESDIFYELNDVKEEYDINKDIKGLIVEKDHSPKYSFIQTNGSEDKAAIQIENRESESIEDFKKMLDKLDFPEEKQYTEEAFIDLIEVDVDDLIAFNLDHEDITLNGIDIFKYKGQTDVTIYYIFTVEDKEIMVSIRIEDDPGTGSTEDPIQLDNGLTVYPMDLSQSVYTFTDQGFKYVVTFVDDKTIDSELLEGYLEHLNVPLLSK